MAGIISSAMTSDDAYVGSLRIVDTRSFIVPKNETVSFTVDAMGWKARLRLVFQPDAAEQEIKIQADGANEATITFNKWISPLGSATLEPAELAKLSGGQRLYFMVVHHHIGRDSSNATGKLDIQFLVGG
jgi:hypothetical protein